MHDEFARAIGGGFRMSGVYELTGKSFARLPISRAASPATFSQTRPTLSASTLPGNGIDYPRHAKLVDQAGEAQRPEGFSKGHRDFAACGELIEPSARLFNGRAGCYGCQV